jgi:uncharacterized protein YjbI with pentapeptide repeats
MEHPTMTRDEIVAAVAGGKSLAEADLTGANLFGAALSYAKLAHADLTGANLADANLFGANLFGANLADANLFGATLSGAIGVICAGIDPRGYRFVGVMHDDGPHVAAGCRWFTLAKARAHWATNPDALARVELIAAWGARVKEVK